MADKPKTKAEKIKSGIYKTTRGIGFAAFVMTVLAGVQIFKLDLKYKMRPKIAKRIEERIAPYVHKNLEKIMQEQEKIGIKHKGKPKIKFYKAEKAFLGFFGKDDPLGCYDPPSNDMYLSTTYTIAPDSDLLIWQAHKLGVDIDMNIENTTRHELGHFYADQLSESIGNGDWPKFTTNKPFNEPNYEDIGVNIISEGIAEYFENKPLGIKPTWKLKQWPKNPKEFEERPDLAYTLGYWLVTPIIDRFKKEGIKYLITNPMQLEDLLNPQQYRRKAMRELEENN